MNMMLALLILLQDPLEPAAHPVKIEPKEATIFKDGHAFILAEGLIPAKTGWYVTTEVPEAVLGTLWTFTGHAGACVEVVRAGFETIERKEPCLTLADALEACIGRDVVLDLHGTLLEGTLLDVPRRKEAPETPGETLLVRTQLGTQILHKSRVLSIRSKDALPVERTLPSVRRRLLVKVVVEDNVREERIPLRFVYVQKGLRWIPEYHAELLPDKKVRLTLQGTLVNELADLKDVSASLVVGIPNFLLKDTLSPLALRQAAAGLSQYFHPGQRAGQMLTNAMMTQVARYGESQGDAPAPAGPDPVVEGGAADEYFLYPRPHLTLKKGERSSAPVFSAIFDSEDVYTLEVLPRVSLSMASGSLEELRRAMAMPKLRHGLKLKNSGRTPWTTGPAMIVRDGRALAQDMLRFTPAGGDTVLPMAEVSDVAVRIKDVELRRVHNIPIDGTSYSQVFMTGTICLVNHRPQDLPVRVDRTAVGRMELLKDKGTSEAFDAVDLPWERYDAAIWRQALLGVNAAFRATWTAVIPAGKSVEFGCEWSYYRRG